MDHCVRGRTVRRLACAALAAAALAAGCSRPAPQPAKPAAEAPLAWAFPGAYPGVTPPAPRPRSTGQVTLPGVPRSFGEAQVHDFFRAVDWRPDEHGPMPAVVSQGRKPDVLACGFCHLPSGQGRPENAAIAGLPAPYITAQLRAFADGDRRGARAGWVPSGLMAKIAHGLTPAEIAAASTYFSRQHFVPRLRVVEAATVPRMEAFGFVYRPAAGGGDEAIGQRIMEGPDDVERFELRDDHVGYTAYAPPGSIARGRALAAGGGGIQVCASCHGEGLRGGPVAPPIAGRSPSYLVRQLYALRTGTRHAPEDAPMTSVTAAMTPAQMIDLAAYVGALKP